MPIQLVDALINRSNAFLSQVLGSIGVQPQISFYAQDLCLTRFVFFEWNSYKSLISKDGITLRNEGDSIQGTRNPSLGYYSVRQGYKLLHLVPLEGPRHCIRPRYPKFRIHQNPYYTLSWKCLVQSLIGILYGE